MLLREGVVVQLGGKAFDTLVLLVEGAGQLQSQRSLMDRLWPDVAVEQNNLQYNISILRRVLGDAPSVEIQTVRGQGYRLQAQVTRLGAEVPEAHSEGGSSLAHQRTHFCKAADGARLAYALLGDGAPIVKVAHWLSHLELDARGPLWGHWLSLLARDRCLVRYDARGNGLSDWAPPSITFDDFVADLAQGMDAAGVQRAPLVGISQGAAVAVAYAAEHPERVSALVLVGGCARGWRVKRRPKLDAHFEALMVLMRQGWGRENPAFRQIFTTGFFPGASQEQVTAFNELQRQTTSPDNAARLLSALGDVDVRGSLDRVRVPTLVVHCRGDNVVPFGDGLELASGIRGARFVPIDSDNHLLLASEPGWRRFVSEIERFLGELPRDVPTRSGS